jgi:tRNA (guanine37-N1)-methyltransferase
MSDDPNDMFAPPVNRAMQVLDRSFFRKTVNTSAARVFSPKDISRVRSDLERSRDILKTRLDSVRPDIDAARAAKGGKCLILKPEVVHNGTTHTCPTSATASD